MGQMLHRPPINDLTRALTANGAALSKPFCHVCFRVPSSTKERGRT